MEKKIFKTFALLFTAAFFFSIMSGFGLYEKKPWPVPDNYKNMKNPVASDAESIAAGSILYAMYCKSCHGKTGLGDGQRAMQLKTEPGDFSGNDFQSQTDGSLFYKTSEGRDEMPDFKERMTDDNDRWRIVNFMRTLKK